VPVVLALNEGAPKLLFRGKCVVGLAIHHEIPCAIIATERVCVLVVQLQEPGFSTASTRVIDKGALLPIAIAHLSPHSRRHGLALDALARNSGSLFALRENW
jgi:hypothetical protein